MLEAQRRIRHNLWLMEAQSPTGGAVRRKVSIYVPTEPVLLGHREGALVRDGAGQTGTPDTAPTLASGRWAPVFDAET